MIESGYYPAGAEFDPRAPWNQSEPDPVSRDIDYSCTLHRTATVETTNYVPGTWEKDEDGFGYREGDDFSDTDWLEEYKESHYTPAELIAMLKDVAAQLARGEMPACKKALRNPAKYWQDIADECEGWTVEEEYTEEA